MEHRGRVAAGAVVVAVLAVALAAVMAAGAAAAQASALRPAELAQARDYVLAACPMARYPGTPLAAEAETWAGGVVEHGSLPGTAYAALNDLVKAVPEAPHAKDGTPMRLQSCFAFVQARDFPSRVQRALKGVR